MGSGPDGPGDVGGAWDEHGRGKHYVGGEVLFVDFSGKRPSVVDRLTGEVTEVELFVAVMGASNFTYVEAVATQRVGDWIGRTRERSRISAVCLARSCRINSAREAVDRAITLRGIRIR